MVKINWGQGEYQCETVTKRWEFQPGDAEDQNDDDNVQKNYVDWIRLWTGRLSGGLRASASPISSYLMVYS